MQRDLLIPVVHETTYDELRKVSPLLASRNELNTADDSMADIATKIAELVALDDELVTVGDGNRRGDSIGQARKSIKTFGFTRTTPRSTR